MVFCVLSMRKFTACTWIRRSTDFCGVSYGLESGRRLISFVTMTMSSLYCLAGSQRVKCKLQAPSLSLTPNPIVPFIVQDAVLDKGDVDMQKKAALAEQLE